MNDKIDQELALMHEAGQNSRPNESKIYARANAHEHAKNRKPSDSINVKLNAQLVTAFKERVVEGQSHQALIEQVLQNWLKGQKDTSDEFLDSDRLLLVLLVERLERNPNLFEQLKEGLELLKKAG